MCVTVICAKRDMTDDEINRCARSNGDGIGIAWLSGNGTVMWKKGLEVWELKQFLRDNTIPFPYQVHFRLSSIGGIRRELCHPFPVTPEAPVDLEGETDKPVLMHNGHLYNWDDIILPVLHEDNIPKGWMSDTRAMAWLTSHYSDFPSIIGEKISILHPDGTLIYYNPKLWTQVNGAWFSNMGWDYKIYTKHLYYYAGFEPVDIEGIKAPVNSLTFFNENTLIRAKEFQKQYASFVLDGAIDVEGAIAHAETMVFTTPTKTTRYGNYLWNDGDYDDWYSLTKQEDKTDPLDYAPLSDRHTDTYDDVEGANSAALAELNGDDEASIADTLRRQFEADAKGDY